MEISPELKLPIQNCFGQCHGRHHSCICTCSEPTDNLRKSRDLTKDLLKTSTSNEGPTITCMFADAQVPVLLQTAKVQLLNLEDNCNHPCIIARAV